MNSKQRFDFYVQGGILTADKDIETVQSLVNSLIDALYKPVLGFSGCTKVDPVRIIEFGIDDTEPINWGALQCRELYKMDTGGYHVVIDEASPGNCETFCEYIESFMKSYGWDCHVVTEW